MSSRHEFSSSTLVTSSSTKYSCMSVLFKCRLNTEGIPVASAQWGSSHLSGGDFSQGVVTFIRPVEPSATGIKIESSDQEAI